MSRSRQMKPAEKVRRVACPTTIGTLTGCGAGPGARCVNADGSERVSNHAARQRAHRQAFPPVPSIKAQGGPARDRFGRELGTVTGDTALQFGGMCAQPGCDEPLLSRESSVKTSRGWSHRACAPGADDA